MFIKQILLLLSCYHINFKISRTGQKKRVIEQGLIGPLEKCRQQVLEEQLGITSTSRGFRANNHAVAPYERIKRGLFYFYPKRLAEKNGIQPESLNCRINNSHSNVLHLFNF